MTDPALKAWVHAETEGSTKYRLKKTSGTEFPHLRFSTLATADDSEHQTYDNYFLHNDYCI